MSGAPLDQPVFPDTLGGFRDPDNVRRELREARGAGDLLTWCCVRHEGLEPPTR
jgi:hypothetical protein